MKNMTNGTPNLTSQSKKKAYESEGVTSEMVTKLPFMDEVGDDHEPAIEWPEVDTPTVFKVK
jgi:hypothetical protein